MLYAQGSGNKAWHIARGPLSVVLGIGLGLLAAVVCSFTKLWNTSYKRSFILVAAGALHDPVLLLWSSHRSTHARHGRCTQLLRPFTARHT